jgi:predicted nucleotidyltransferase
MLGTSTSKVTALVGDLKRKGVTSAQDFIKKYHPDTNPTTPKEYLHNFKEIIDNFRGKNSVGVTTMDLGQLAREEYMKSQEAARVINKMMEKKAAVAEFTPDGREKEVQQYPQKGKKFHEELPADGWAGPILDGRLID